MVWEPPPGRREFAEWWGVHNANKRQPPPRRRSRGTEFRGLGKVRGKEKSSIVWIFWEVAHDAPVKKGVKKART